MTKTLRKLLQKLTSTNDIFQVDTVLLSNFYHQGTYTEYFNSLRSLDVLQNKIKRLVESARKKKQGNARDIVLDAPMFATATPTAAAAAATDSSVSATLTPAVASEHMGAGDLASLTPAFNSTVQQELHLERPGYQEADFPLSVDDLSAHNVNWTEQQQQQETEEEEEEDEEEEEEEAEEEEEEEREEEEEEEEEEEGSAVYSRARKLVEGISAYMASFFYSKRVTSRKVARDESKDVSKLRTKVASLQAKIETLAHDLRQNKKRHETYKTKMKKQVPLLIAQKKRVLDIQTEMDGVKQELSAMQGNCEELQAKLKTITENFSLENVATWGRGHPYPPLFILMLMECLALNGRR
jgi:hypothetical protein